MAGITAKQTNDFPEWYQQVVKEAELAENSVVRGCMVIKPYGYALWEQIQSTLDQMIKDAGVKNAYFPLFIPQEFITREAEHVEGFAPELLTVTHVGDKELAEKLVIRPTSETIIYDTYSRWIQSYRDLPLLINQWANVVRWEKRTRLFLRTTEFLWQEGHTAHANHEGAASEVERALAMYERLAKEYLAIHVIPGKKTDAEKFAGAEYTRTIEGLMRDGKALQMGTSHHLADHFAKAFNILFSDKDGVQKHVHQTSWGVSTRLIGGIIMAHGDDKGLRLPPRIAPIQVVIVPILKTPESNQEVLQHTEIIANELKKENIRVHIDARDHLTPGFKFNEYELKGVPLRIELGPKDIASNSVVCVSRITGEKKTIGRSELISKVSEMLETIQNELYESHKQMVEASTHEITSYDQFKNTLEKGGFLKAWWCNDSTLEKQIQEETKATIRCIIAEDTADNHTCFYTGKKATIQVLFARAY